MGKYTQLLEDQHPQSDLVMWVLSLLYHFQAISSFHYFILAVSSLTTVNSKCPITSNMKLNYILSGYWMKSNINIRNIHLKLVVNYSYVFVCMVFSHNGVTSTCRKIQLYVSICICVWNSISLWTLSQYTLSEIIHR